MPGDKNSSKQALNGSVTQKWRQIKVMYIPIARVRYRSQMRYKFKILRTCSNMPNNQKDHHTQNVVHRIPKFVDDKELAGCVQWILKMHSTTRVANELIQCCLCEEC